jgi:hypothetical protein
MTDFELFIKKNAIKKKELAEFLGTSNAFITQLCKGVAPLPADKLKKIKGNLTWDTSMLVIDRPSITARAEGNAKEEIGSRNKNFCPGETDAASRIAVLEKEIEMLKERLKDKDGQIEFLKTLIK